MLIYIIICIYALGCVLLLPFEIDMSLTVSSSSFLLSTLSLVGGLVPWMTVQLIAGIRLNCLAVCLDKCG